MNMTTINLNITEKEAFEMIKEYHPDTYDKRLQPHVKNIIGLAKIKGFTLLQSFQLNMEITLTNSKSIYLLAAYHLLKLKFELIQEELDLIESYKNHIKLQYKIIEKEKGSDRYKALRRIAVSNKIKELEDEKTALIASLKTSTCIESN